MLLSENGLKYALMLTKEGWQSMSHQHLSEKPEIEDKSKQEAFSPSPVSPQRQRIEKLAEPIMIFIGVIGQSLFYLQAYKIYTVGSAEDVSALGFSFALFSLVSWFIYGLIIKNKVLIYVNAFAVIGASLTLLAIFLVS
jgi:MtN3 and saliva related transmembrane protein